MQNYILKSILLSLAIYLCASKSECNHNDLNYSIATSDYEDLSTNSGRNLNTQEPIRITFDFSLLSSVDASTRNYIKKLVQLAGQFFTENLKVIRAQSNIKATGTTCIDLNIPSSDKTTGIANSDLHIYVKTSNDGSKNALATAGACVNQASNKRPIFGRVDFNLANFDTSKINDNGEFEDNLETTLHEITHILAFSSGLYQFWINPQTNQPYGQTNIPIIKKTIRGTESNILTSPKVRQLAREHYGCPTAEGMQLEEYGGSGSAGSHWERVILENEYMTASAISHDAVYSKFTFALLEDSGWYQPSYESVDEIDWGKGRGCEFLESCDNKFPEFNDSEYHCNFYHSTGIKISPTNKDVFADNCSMGILITNFNCINPSNAGNNDQYTGNFFDLQQSRCFDSNLISTKLSQHTFKDVRCFKYECTSDGGIDVFLAGEKYSIDKQSNKIDVLPKGSNQFLKGYVNGPQDWNGFCNTYPTPCKNYCSQNGYCFAKKCHCSEGFAGSDCSIPCANNNYVKDGTCLNSKNCPPGSILQPAFKECIQCTSSQVYYNGQCQTSCPIKYYPDGQKICQPCKAGCGTCENEISCLTCEAVKYKYEKSISITQCLDSCPAKMFSDSQKVCQSCDSSCLTCSNASSCSTCEEGKYTTGSSLCQKCMSGCGSCNNGSTCKQCEQGKAKYENDQKQTSCVDFCPETHENKNGICYLKDKSSDNNNNAPGNSNPGKENTTKLVSKILNFGLIISIALIQFLF